jgi:hypothetical protein
MDADALGHAHSLSDDERPIGVHRIPNRRLTSYSVGLDVTAKLEHRVPPPILWAQNPCFLELTDRVAP